MSRSDTAGRFCSARDDLGIAVAAFREIDFAAASRHISTQPSAQRAELESALEALEQTSSGASWSTYSQTASIGGAEFVIEASET